MKKFRTLLGSAILAAASFGADIACAQTTESERLAVQWRAARRAELVAQRQRLDAQMAALDNGATPDTLGADTPPAAPIAATSGTALVATPVTPAPTPVVVAEVAPAPPPPAAADPYEGGKQKFGGIDFGVGISFTGDMGHRDRVSSASLVNGVVRVTDENNGRARIMLESHYLFTPDGSFLFGLLGPRNDSDIIDEKTHVTTKYGTKRWGFGPFISSQVPITSSRQSAQA